MRCSLYSSDGPLMSEGSCEQTDGTVKMTAEKWHMTPTVGGQPLTLLMEDGTQHYVNVANVHVVQSDASSGPTEVYDLTLLDTERQTEKGGFLAGIKSLFGR